MYIGYFRYHKNDKYAFKFKLFVLNLHAILLRIFERFYYFKNLEDEHQNFYYENYKIVRDMINELIHYYDAYDFNGYSDRIKEKLSQVEESICWKYLRIRPNIDEKDMHREKFKEIMIKKELLDSLFKRDLVGMFYKNFLNFEDSYDYVKVFLSHKVDRDKMVGL